MALDEARHRHLRWSIIRRVSSLPAASPMDPNRSSYRPGDRDGRRIEPHLSRHSEFSPAVLVGMGALMLIVLAAGIWLLLRAA